MMHGFESLAEGEVRDVTRGHRIDRDSSPDLDFGEDAGEAVAGDLPDGVVEWRLRKLRRTLHPDVHDAAPSLPPHPGERRSDRMEHAIDFRSQHSLPRPILDLGEVLTRIPESTRVVHQDVDGPEFLLRPAEHLPHLVSVRGV